MPHATLDVDLSAIRANYRLLKNRHAQHSVAAVVKADAYGLGVEAVSRALLDEGCKMFFVATLEEGIELRALLPESAIGVFNGLLEHEEDDYRHYQLIPVLNDRAELERFLRYLAGLDDADPWLGILHVDTGMTRLGLSIGDLQAIETAKRAYATLHIPLVMSHLACANEPEHPKNAEQLERFQAALALLPNTRASFVNSAGIFLPPEFHFDMGRPGCALYGINPANGTNPMQPVATLSASLLQLRTLERDGAVGYGATYPVAKGARIAIVGLGYADGWLRSLSNNASAYVAGHEVPVAGRISMDMLALDVSQVPESLMTPGVRAEFINRQQTVDDIADACGTIGYEVFTRMGRRVKRVYR